MESWDRHTTARNHLLCASSPLIEWKWAVDKVVVHHGNSPTQRTFVTFRLPSGLISQERLSSIFTRNRSC